MTTTTTKIMFAQSLVVLEGVDGVGKSTIIKQLQDKYGPSQIKTLAFPVNREILKVPYDKKDDEAIQGYHKMFLKDFIDNQKKIGDLCAEAHDSGGVVVLDRYFPSWIAYFLLDVMDHMALVLHYDSKRIVQELISIQNESFEHLVKALILPTCIIYMYPPSNVTDSKTKALHGTYDLVLTALKKRVPPFTLEIEALQKDTFSKVEMCLKQRGYL